MRHSTFLTVVFQDFTKKLITARSSSLAMTKMNTAIKTRCGESFANPGEFMLRLAALEDSSFNSFYISFLSGTTGIGSVRETLSETASPP